LAIKFYAFRAPVFLQLLAPFGVLPLKIKAGYSKALLPSVAVAGVHHHGRRGVALIFLSMAGILSLFANFKEVFYAYPVGGYRHPAAGSHGLLRLFQKYHAEYRQGSGTGDTV
jgi:hypothetical protein